MIRVNAPGGQKKTASQLPPLPVAHATRVRAVSPGVSSVDMDQAHPCPADGQDCSSSVLRLLTQTPPSARQLRVCTFSILASRPSRAERRRQLAELLCNPLRSRARLASAWLGGGEAHLGWTQAAQDASHNWSVVLCTRTAGVSFKGYHEAHDTRIALSSVQGALRVHPELAGSSRWWTTCGGVSYMKRK